uniref:Uncharacterized protein n=1 Tax=Meloidogyne incognita TaxID=6306 RepID=A0A914NFE4_MELIC
MAAELGSHRALSILQLFFDGELNFNNNKNMRPPKLNTQKEKEVAEINFDKNKLNKNQLDLFKWIFERIANEQKEEKLKDKPEGTDIIGETTSTDTQNNSVSEQNERLRDLEIRYRWLVNFKFTTKRIRLIITTTIIRIYSFCIYLLSIKNCFKFDNKFGKWK